jgi:hypothetical protein
MNADQNVPLPLDRAAARVLELTQVAHPADVPHILGALSDNGMAAGVEHLGTKREDMPADIRKQFVKKYPDAALYAAEPDVTDAEPHPDDPTSWPLTMCSSPVGSPRRTGTSIGYVPGALFNGFYSEGGHRCPFATSW